MRNRSIVWAASVAVLWGLGCASAGENQAPSLYVEVAGDLAVSGGRVTNDQTVYFAPGGGTIRLYLGNTGDADLTLDQVEVVQLNGDMAVLPNLSGLSWPKVVLAGQFRSSDPSVLELRVKFTPGPVVDDQATILRFHTDDFENPGGVFTLNLAPEEEKADLNVSPSNYVFLEATVSKPDSTTFTLSNAGTASLALADFRFEGGNDAFSLTGNRPTKDTIIDPDYKGSSNGPRTITVEYRPVEPPDSGSLVILWGPVLSTGLTCTAEAICKQDEKICPDGPANCPYTCANGRCMCLTDADCKASMCANPADCDVMCLTGVCRAPERKVVPLSGQSLPGQLRVDHADLMTGCVDFIEVTEAGQSCTKIVQLLNDGEGTVKVTKPFVRVGELPDGQPSPYEVRWYRLGATQEAVCGPVSGDEINEGQFTITAANQPVNVAITYTAPSTRGVNGELVIDYAAPFAGQEIVAICGGDKKGELGVAPIPQAGPVVLFADPDGKAQKTVVVMNKGNEVLELTGVGVDVEPGYPAKFSLVDPPTPQELAIDPGQFLLLTVEYDGNHDLGVLNGALTIDYVDPLLGGDLYETVQLRGQNSFDGIVLPIADPGEPGDYAGAKVGENIVLNGAGSFGGTFPIDPTSGYTWFISDKPMTSRVFLNPGPGSAQVTFIPDVPGTYEFRLVVFSYDDVNQVPYFSHEAVLDVTVAP
jgi:hypothetical protein